MQPGTQNGVGLQLIGISRQICEYRLGDFFGQMRRADAAQGHGIHQIHMTGNQGGKGFLRMPFGVLAQQIPIVGFHVHRVYRR